MTLSKVKEIWIVNNVFDFFRQFEVAREWFEKTYKIDTNSEDYDYDVNELIDGLNDTRGTNFGCDMEIIEECLENIRGKYSLTFNDDCEQFIIKEIEGVV